MTFFGLIKTKREKEIDDIQRVHLDLSQLEDLESKKEKLLALLDRVKGLKDRKKIEDEIISIERTILKDLDNIKAAEEKELGRMQYREKQSIKRAIKKFLEKHKAISFEADSMDTFNALTEINAWMENREAQYISKSSNEERAIEALKDTKVRARYAEGLLQSEINPSKHTQYEIRLGLAIEAVLRIYGLKT
jgi:hypothetical protein